MVFVILHETTNKQLKNRLYGDYFITVTAVFSHPSLPFLQYHRIIVTVPAVLLLNSPHSHSNYRSTTAFPITTSFSDMHTWSSIEHIPSHG